LGKVTTSGTAVTIKEWCYNVTKTGAGTPPVPPPPPPPYGLINAPGVHTSLSGTMDGNGFVSLGFDGIPCLPADSDNDSAVDDGVKVQLTTQLKNDAMLPGNVHLDFYLNDLTCTTTPTSSSDVAFTPTNLADNSDSDIDDPNIAGTNGPDGCTTSQELGTDEMLGGNRDPWNPWDFYDVNGDKYVDLANDILGVAFKYQAAPPNPAYNVAYDRGGTLENSNPWNLKPPDNYIDLANDILGVAFQYQHSCV
jgi:hypothetical protein